MLLEIPIILASASQQRMDLFATLGKSFGVMPADIDEKAIQDDDLEVRAQKVALAKGEAILATNPGAVIIAADTFIELNGKIYEKPLSKDEAIEMLHDFSGNWLNFITGLYIHTPNNDYSESHVTRASIRRLSDEECARYAEQNPVTIWAGGISPAYTFGMALMGDIEGSMTTCTHGLPLERVVEILRAENILA